MKSTSNALTTVPYNEFGKAIITEIRKMAKRNGWKVRLRGRNSNRKAVAQKLSSKSGKEPINRWIHASLRQSIPLKYSERVAVYVYNGREHITSTVLSDLEGSGTVK